MSLRKYTAAAARHVTLQHHPVLIKEFVSNTIDMIIAEAGKGHSHAEVIIDMDLTMEKIVLDHFVGMGYTVRKNTYPNGAKSIILIW